MGSTATIAPVLSFEQGLGGFLKVHIESEPQVAARNGQMFFEQADPPAGSVNLELPPSPAPVKILFKCTFDSDFADVLAGIISRDIFRS